MTEDNRINLDEIRKLKKHNNQYSSEREQFIALVTEAMNSISSINDKQDIFNDRVLVLLELQAKEIEELKKKVR